MKKAQVILFLLMMPVTAFSQTRVDYFDKKQRETKVTPLPRDTNEKTNTDTLYQLGGSEATPLPRGTKEKVINYTKMGYIISGKFRKNVPVYGTMLKITDSRNNRVLYGKYMLIDGKSAIHGKLDYTYNDNKSSASLYGKFIVTNGADELIVKPKLASDLSITQEEIDHWAGNWRNYPVTLQKYHYVPHILTIDATDGGWHYSNLKAEIPGAVVESLGYEDVEGLLLSDTLNVEISYDSGAKFMGKAVGKSKNGDIKYTLLDGKMTGMNYGQTIKVERLQDSLKKYAITTFTAGVTEQLYMPLLMENIDSLWNKAYYLRVSPDVLLKYKNGDEYRGKFWVENNNIVPTDGTYIYKNGDKFEGKLYGKKIGKIPIEGKTIFKDGTVEEGNWLSEYGLTEAQLNSISSLAVTPSDAKDMAKIFVKENNYNKLIAEAEQYDKNGNFTKAKSLYEKALEYKNNTAIVKKIEELEKQIKRQNLVRKYGNEYADKILNGKIEIGMTAEMCKDALAKSVGIEFYRISTWRDYDGAKIETWKFDYEYGIKNATNYLLTEGIENKDGTTLLAYGFLRGIGKLTAGAADSMAEYKYLKFRDGILISLSNEEKSEGLNILEWLF